MYGSDGPRPKKAEGPPPDPVDPRRECAAGREAPKSAVQLFGAGTDNFLVVFEFEWLSFAFEPALLVLLFAMFELAGAMFEFDEFMFDVVVFVVVVLVVFVFARFAFMFALFVFVVSPPQAIIPAATTVSARAVSVFFIISS